MAIGKDGAIYGSGFSKGKVYKIAKTGVSIFADDGIKNPNGLAFDKNGNLIIVDFGGNKIHSVTPSGNRTVLVDSVEYPSGLIGSPFTEDTFYFTQYGKNQINKLTTGGEVIPFIQGDSINGIQGPVGLAFDSLKNLYVANFEDSKIHKVTPDGTISYFATVPGGFYLGFIAYAKGHLYGTSWGNNHIYRIDLQGNVKLFAGSIKGSKDGPALEAEFDWPNGIIASKGEDTLYVSDYTTKNIRLITPLEIITDILDPKSLISDFKIISHPYKRLELIYTLTKSVPVSISVFSMGGKELQNIELGQKQTGRNKTKINLTNTFSTGIYLIEINASEDIFRKKAYVQP